MGRWSYLLRFRRFASCVLTGAVAVYLGTTAVAQSLPPITFRTPSTFAAGLSPNFIAVGDFNSDGKLDLAVANYYSNDVSVLLGNGDNMFQAAKNYATGLTPYWIVLGDFNSDEKSDLAISNAGSNDVSILVGNGDGTFQPASNYPAGATPYSLALGDLNRDGILDMAAANGGSGLVSILFGDGNGSFQIGASYSVGATPNAVAIDDFNADGMADMAVTNWNSSSVSILLGDGNSPGSFAPAVNYATGPNPNSIEVRDLNGDQKLDLAVLVFGDDFSGTNLSVLSGHGDGTFDTATDIVAGLSGASFAIIEDFDGNGSLDLAITGYYSNYVAVLLGNGSGSFATPVMYSVGKGPYPAAKGDFNGDSKLDIVIGNFDEDDVSILSGNGDGSFVPVGYTTGPIPRYVIADDFNGDNRPDLAVANFGSNDVSVLIGDGDGTFQQAVNYPTDSGPVHIVAGDVNQDNHVDLIVAAQNANTISVLLGNGNGTFQAQLSYFAGTWPEASALGNFLSLDGQPDLVVTNFSTRTMTSLYGFTDGRFFFESYMGIGENPFGIVAADFNSDGNDDVAVDFQGKVLLLLGNRYRGFSISQEYEVGGSPGFLIVADVNADRLPDLIVPNSGSATVSVLLASPSGVLQAATTFAAGNFPVAVAAADFNLDGNLDLAVPNGDWKLSILTGDGQGSFGSPVQLGSVPSWSIATSDFNADGKPDLAIADVQRNDVLVLLNTTESPTAAVALSDASIEFSDTELNTAQAAEITLTNTGTSALFITDISVAGQDSSEFSQTNDCASSVLPAGTCTITIAFTPMFVGTRSGTLVISNNAPDSPQVISLSGDGIQPGSPIVTLSSSALAFGDSEVGTASSAQASIVSNSGSAPMNISNIVITGPNATQFLLTNDCSGTVSPGSSCTITVVFAPSLTGVSVAAVSIIDDAANSPQTITLAGTGIVDSSIGDVCVAPPSGLVSWWAADGSFDDLAGANHGANAGDVSFASGQVGQAFHLTQAANSYITLPNSPDLLPSSGQLTIEAWIRPDWNAHNLVDQILSKIDQCGGSRSYNLSIDKEYVNGPYQPGVIVFSASNGGDDAISVTTLPRDDKFHHLAGTYDGASMNVYLDGILVGQKAHTGAIPFTAHPPYIGLQDVCGDRSSADVDEISFYDRALTQTELQAIVDAGSAGKCKALSMVSLSPGSLDFGRQEMNTTSAPQVVTITNSGSTTLAISNISLAGASPGDFNVVTDALPISLVPGATANLRVSMTPSALGNRDADVLITDNAGDSPQMITLTGVGVAATSTVLNSSTSSSVFGDTVTFTAAVSSVHGIPTGTVSFTSDGLSVSTAELGNGEATLITNSLSAGEHTLVAEYSGDSFFSASASTTILHTVNPALTVTTISSTANPSTFGQSVTFMATVSSGVAFPAGAVTFHDGTSVLGVSSLNGAGQAALSTTALAGGTHNITAAYTGSGDFAASTSPLLVQEVDPAATGIMVAASLNPSTFGQSVTFTATVTATSGSPLGVVSFRDGAAAIGNTSVNGAGQATLSTAALIAGSHSITAFYVGDSSFGPSTSAPVSQTVSKASTTSTITSTPNPSTFGQAVTFIATVTSPTGAIPTGVVSFKKGSTVLGSANLSATGQATFTISTLSAGNDNVTAVYAATPNFLGSTSASVTQVVNLKPTTTTMGSSLNPSHPGQMVTFTAAVSSATGGTPSGTVTFQDGAKKLCANVSLNFGSAACGTSALKAGSHNITATYGGDSSFSGSSSPVLVQTVN